MEKIGNVQMIIIFSVLYFVLVTPVGLLMRIFKDSLRVKQFPQWLAMEDNSSTLKKMKEQG